MKRLVWFAALGTVMIACGRDFVTTPRNVRPGGAQRDIDPNLNPDSVHLRYVCADSFRVRSANDDSVTLTWRVDSTADSGTVFVPARDMSMRPAEAVFTTPHAGTTRIYLGSLLLATARNTELPCTMKRLTVFLGSGVVGLPATTDTTLPIDTTVTYAFQAATGFTHVVVVVDDSVMSGPTGSITMKRNHDIQAYADTALTLPDPSDPLVVEMRGLLTAPEPVKAYRRLLRDIKAIYAQQAFADAFRTVQLASLVAIDPVADSTAMFRLDSALAFHEFTDTIGVDTASQNGGGGVATDVRPTARARSASLAPGHRTSFDAGIAADTNSKELTTVLYVNGIDNLPLDAAITRNALIAALQASGDTGSTTLMTNFYNRTLSVQSADYKKTHLPCLLKDIQRGGFMGFATRVIAWSACADNTRNYKQSEHDWQEAYRAEVNIPANTGQVEEDADSLSRYLTRHKQRLGTHYVIVAHSQGNLMTQQALQLMTRRGEFNPAADSLCIGVAAIAAPRSDGWLVDNRHLVGVQLANDIILALGTNSFPQIRLPQLDTLDAIVAELGKAETGQEIAGMLLASGVRMHSMSTYLGNSAPRIAITNAVSQLHRECTLRQISLSPSAVTSQVQATSTFSVVATNRNGVNVPLNRIVTWTVDPRLLFNLSTQVLTTPIPGLFGLAGSVFNDLLSSNSTITVPPVALAFTPTVLFKDAWNVGVGDNVPPGIPPDPGPAPTWDGDPHTCVGQKTVVATDPVTHTPVSWPFFQHCWYAASATVAPPAAVNIDHYVWEWFDVFDRRIDAHITTTPFVTEPDEPLDFLQGYESAKVTAFDAQGNPLGTQSVCFTNCGS